MYPLLWEFPNIQIFSYPLFMGMAWGLAWSLCLGMLPIENRRGLSGLFLGTFLFSWVGSKIFFLLLSAEYSPARYLNSSAFWLGGGFVFYGGLFFGSCYVLFYSLILKKFPPSRLVFLLPALGWGHALGRVGCFLSGCCYGSACSLPWAVFLHHQKRHPVQLYEALLLSLLSWTCYRLLKKGSVGPHQIIGLYLTSYSLGRFFLEFLRGDLVRGIHWGGLSSSQFISLGVAILGIRLLFHRPQKNRATRRNLYV